MPSGKQQQVFYKEFQKLVINLELPPISVQTENGTYVTCQKFIYIACKKWQFQCKDEELVTLSTQYFLQETSATDPGGLKPYPIRRYMESPSLGAIM
jgi:hypothetical protein